MASPISPSPARIPEKLPPRSSSIPPPRRVGFVVPKLTFRVRRTAAPIVDFIEISQMSSFRQNGGWRALRSSCRCESPSMLRACMEGYYRTICMFVNHLETAGLVVTAGRRVRRHRARKQKIPYRTACRERYPLLLALRVIARAFSIQLWATSGDGLPRVIA